MGDSRVVLGYSKEIYPETLDPAPFSTSGVDSAGTTPEDARTVSTKGRAAADAHRSFKRPANLQLSTDHKPDIPEERNRILKAGE